MISKKFASFEINGFEDYLMRIQQEDKDINVSVAKAIEASAQPIAEDVKAWAEKHKFTGATERGVIKPKVNIEGNKIYAEVGISGEGESWHAVFVEYGSPHNKADPGIRNAFSNNKKRVRQIQVEVLKQEGASVDD